MSGEASGRPGTARQAWPSELRDTNRTPCVVRFVQKTRGARRGGAACAEMRIVGSRGGVDARGDSHSCPTRCCRPGHSLQLHRPRREATLFDKCWGALPLRIRSSKYLILAPFNYYYSKTATPRVGLVHYRAPSPHYRAPGSSRSGRLARSSRYRCGAASPRLISASTLWGTCARGRT